MNFSIKEIREELGNKFFLPAIQRAFVWKPKQIEDLFDSLMQDFPIGTILLWQLREKEKINHMRFYSCDPHYEQNQEPKEAMNPLNNKNEIFAVLDGQQRLTAIYIATHGYYRVKSYSKKQKFIEKELYINLLYSASEDQSTKYQFQFLDNIQSQQKDENTFWYKIKEISNWKDSFDRQDILKIIKEANHNIPEQKIREIDKILDKLYYLLNSYEKKIFHAEVIQSEKSIMDVLEIFVRVNSQGTKLTKTDLLLSTISPYWERVRNEFAELIKDIKTDYNLSIDQDLIMKTALACTDIEKRSVVFNLENFGETAISKIKTQWEKIKEALINTADLLKELGFYDANMKAYNVIIPIAFYFFNNTGRISEQLKNDIKLFVSISLLKKVFSGASDTTINKMIKIIENEKSFVAIMKNKEFQENYRVSDTILDKWVELEKGPYSYLVLSLIYGKLDPKILLEQDHIHPKSKFKEKYFKQSGIDPNLWEILKEQKDCLANLQLLKGGLNKAKSSKPLLDWLQEKNISQKQFKLDNFIPEEVNLEFKNFEEFYTERKKELRKILNKQLQMLK